MFLFISLFLLVISISYSTKQGVKHINLDIYNIKGQKIESLFINCYPEFIEGSVYDSNAPRPSSFPERRFGTQDDNLRTVSGNRRMRQAGKAQYSITWNGTNDHNQPVASGIYLYKLQAGNRIFTRKMLLLK